MEEEGSANGIGVWMCVFMCGRLVVDVCCGVGWVDVHASACVYNVCVCVGVGVGVLVGVVVGVLFACVFVCVPA